MKIGIGQIILEESSFKHCDDYLSLEPTEQQEPSEVHLGFHLQRADGGPAFMLRLTATSAEGALYQFSAAYALFGRMDTESGESLPDDIERRLMITGGFMLFPFMREFVASLTSRGRFGPTWLAPADFNDLVPKNAPNVATRK